MVIQSRLICKYVEYLFIFSLICHLLAYLIFCVLRAKRGGNIWNVSLMFCTQCIYYPTTFTLPISPWIYFCVANSPQKSTSTVYLFVNIHVFSVLSPCQMSVCQFSCISVSHEVILRTGKGWCLVGSKGSNKSTNYEVLIFNDVHKTTQTVNYILIGIDFLLILFDNFQQCNHCGALGNTLKQNKHKIIAYIKYTSSVRRKQSNK